ncbi:hypothetical protein [Halorubrum laminariae]|uniref:Uncharacterized protein n=1 Tax=Halorubrum laminariae TaxID=1433523 RepID=A0ABD6BZJ4_9EURY|nr:hypothetical protein [Halorubrum laminariae]
MHRLSASHLLYTAKVAAGLDDSRAKRPGRYSRYTLRCVRDMCRGHAIREIDGETGGSAAYRRRSSNAGDDPLQSELIP